mgnify:CR=1 FL=1
MLTRQVEDSLRAAQEHLRDALAFAARSEKPYVSKHIIVNCTGIPRKGRPKFKLKADISLFRYKKEYDTSFLEEEPISVGYYNEVKGEMIWDFEYNRSMVEKIIHTMTKK